MQPYLCSQQGPIKELLIEMLYNILEHFYVSRSEGDDKSPNIAPIIIICISFKLDINCFNEK